MSAPNEPLFATIKIPLQSMLQPSELDKLMDYAQRERITPDVVVLHALRAFMPQMTPAGPQPELAEAS